MTATLGRFLILASVLVSTTGAFIAYAAGAKRSPEGLKWSQRFAYAFAALMVLATGVMEYALITHDFSVQYVAHVGSTQVPLWVTIVSLWSSLEGSILFWGFILGIYIAATTWVNRDQHQEYADQDDAGHGVKECSIRGDRRLPSLPSTEYRVPSTEY